MKKTLSFLYHLLIANSFFLFLSFNTPSVNNSYESLKGDLDKIAFPVEFTPSFLIYTIPIAFFASLFSNLYNKYFANNNKFSVVHQLTINYLFTTWLYLFVVFFFKLFLELNRLYVITFIFLLLFLLIFQELISEYISKGKNLKTIIVLILLLFPNIYISIQSFQNTLTNETFIDEDVIASENLLINSISEIPPEDDLECNEWKGSPNYIGCLYGLNIQEYEYEFQVSNLVVFNEELYILLKNGLIYKQSNTNSAPKLFIDLSSKVYTSFPGIEQGLYGLAFHPSDKHLVVTYSNDEIALVVEKYEYSDEGVINDSAELLIKIANNQRYHFGGSLIWSDYFNDFLLGVGDMKSNVIPVLQSDPLNTTSFRGKIVLLNSFSSQNSPLIAEHNINPSLKNIVAFGLRNPWQFLEYQNRLFITDVGSQFIEELNILDLNSFSSPKEVLPTSFGWPLFSGLEFSTYYEPRGMDELIYDDGSVTDLYYFENGEQIKADKYLIDKSVFPLVYYEHLVNPNVVRAAIIGGDILKNSNSKYFEHYFFTDFVERELFAYDVNKDLLYVFPLPTYIESNPTAVKVSPFENDTLIISYRNGTILTIKLP